MTGWEFDSEVRLLRGSDQHQACCDVRLLPYLDHLCQMNPRLHIYILAWDFLEFLAADREWRQSYLFNHSKTGRIKFRFDSRHPIFGCHHQKMIIVDGKLAFVGGLDLCCGRWSDRRHHLFVKERKTHVLSGPPPFHDVQSMIQGPMVKPLVRLFKRSWLRAGGQNLNLKTSKSTRLENNLPCVQLASDRVAISRTQARTLFPPQRPVREIRQMYIDAIQSAERLIYIENQYFTARAVFRALVNRMRQKNRSALQIILVLPHRIHPIFEDLALGLAQRRMLRILKRVAKQTGHHLGIYYSAVQDSQGKDIPKIIHSKMMLVDDRFLTLGSANAANRSMGLDTELNLAWEATDPSDLLVHSLRQLRVDLLLEHSGIPVLLAQEKLAEVDGLVNFLNQIADSKTYALRHHQMETRFAWLTATGLKAFLYDPEKPLIEESLYRLFRNKWAVFR